MNGVPRPGAAKSTAAPIGARTDSNVISGTRVSPTIAPAPRDVWATPSSPPFARPVRSASLVNS